MRILGVDPGTWNTGVGIIETQGSRYQLIHTEVIAIRAKTPIAERLLEIYRTLLARIREYKPEALALENVFYHKDISAVMKIGQARACAMLAAADQNIEVIEYPPARIKQAVSGNGRATKDQVQHMIKTLLNLKTLPAPDSADALATAICHAHYARSSRAQRSLKNLAAAAR